MNRRLFLKAALWTPVAAAVGIKITAEIRPYPLRDLLHQLQGLKPAQLTSSSSWSVSETFQHCAQSIRFSIFGYPQHYSPWFQHTAGTIALNVFAATGKMHHPLDQPIPGAPALIPELPSDVALQELIYELQQFLSWQGQLAPHFAYGKLSKAQYYSVHYLHLQSHLAEIS